MAKPQDAYRCWFLINQDIRDRPFTTDEQAAVATFSAFLKDKDYGKSVGLFRFDLYVEPSVNFGKHRDSIFLGCAHLTANIDYEAFLRADGAERQKLILNSALVLCKYLSEKVTLPRDFDAKKLVSDYADFLAQESLLLSNEDTSRQIIKVFDTTTFNFVISTTVEVKEEHIHYNLTEIQHYINNELSGKTFGASVKEFNFGYEIYDFEGYMKPRAETAGLKRYGARYKHVLVAKQFDYRQLKGKTHKAQFLILKQNILEAIDDVNKIARKPKYFDIAGFLSTIENILDDYQDKFCG